ncbi:MAG TPA: GNAT family N-acyltransferase [Gemmatimonadales bacterium]|jgi:putative hemolysin
MSLLETGLSAPSRPVTSPEAAPALTGYPIRPDLLPTEQTIAGRYLMRFARSPQDLEAVERLRFEVFNLELREGLDSAFETGRDHDDLDPWFHHLMILSRDSGRVVGTYRLQTAEMAAAGRGFYSRGEYDLSGLPASFLASAVEVGRACVAKEHRNGRVLNLLWRGLAQYLTCNAKRYLFGCCSLTSQEPALGVATMQYLKQRDLLHAEFSAPPLPDLNCESLADPDAVANQQVHIPALFQSYLNLGAKVCGGPAIDRLFKTIDFLVVLDIEALDLPSFRFFFR